MFCLLSAYNIALILFVDLFLFSRGSFLAVIEHDGRAAPLHTDASIVYREEEGPHQTWPTPIASCMDPPAPPPHAVGSTAAAAG